MLFHRRLKGHEGFSKIEIHLVLDHVEFIQFLIELASAFSDSPFALSAIINRHLQEHSYVVRAECVVDLSPDQAVITLC